MIPVPSGVRVWLAAGRTDMRRGMNGLALQVQQALGRDPHAGDLYVFRGRRGDLVKVVWHDGIGMSLYAKRLERGRFIWPSPAGGAVAISGSQLAYMLDGIDWRNPQRTWRPEVAGQGCTSAHPGYLPRVGCDSIHGVTPAPDNPPDDIDALRAALAAERLARREAEARASGAEARAMREFG